MAQQKFNRTEFDFGALKSGLQSLEPPKVSAREIVAELAVDIRSAVNRGVPYASILEYLKGHGLNLAEATLKTYLRDGKPGSRMNYKQAQRASVEARVQGGIGAGSEADGADPSDD